MVLVLEVQNIIDSYFCVCIGQLKFFDLRKLFNLHFLFAHFKYLNKYEGC
jgi:hypothetical protein